MKPLIPPDLKRCQAEWLAGSFLTLGPRYNERCLVAPKFILREVKPGKDGRMGSMSLCEFCLNVFKRRTEDWEDRYAIKPVPILASSKGAAKGLPSDLAAEHEHYRLGTPKRKAPKPRSR